MVADATARGKALVSVESANPGPVPPPEQETEEDEVEEVLGRPQDRRQHVYVSRYRNDEWVMHEEIPEIEETIRVERAAKRLVTEVQVYLALVVDPVCVVELSDVTCLCAGLDENCKIPKKVLRPDRRNHDDQ